jgi:hypothetical protein
MNDRTFLLERYPALLAKKGRGNSPPWAAYFINFELL